MRRVPVLLALALVGVLIASFAPTSASHTIVLDFFAGSGGEAGWVEFSPAPPGATDDFSVRLFIPDADAFAGAELVGATTLPAAEPSFDFLSDTASGSSGGSPRMTLVFNNGGIADLRPLSWPLNTWTTVGGSGGPDWDVRGSCGFQFAQTYASVQTCEAGSGIDLAIIVTDSGWLVSPYTHYIDNIVFGDQTISAPPPTCGDPDTDGDHHSDFAPDENEDGPLSGTVHGIDQALVIPVVTEDGGVVPEVNCAIVKGVLGL